MFECKGCMAKDKEIDHLRANIHDLLQSLEKAQARVMELAEPGVNRRMNPPAQAAAPVPPQMFRIPPQYPGYEPRMEPVVEVDEEA